MRRVAPLVVGLGLLVSAPPASADNDRCAAGLALASSKPVVAFAHLEACLASGGDEAHRSAHRALKRQLDGGEYALVTIATTPVEVAVEIKPLDVVVATGQIYLAPGNYTLEAVKDGFIPVSRPLEITGRYRETVELTLVAARHGPTTHTVDLTGEPGRTEVVRGKDPEHENLIPDRFRQGQPSGLVDPVARRSRWPYAAVALGLVAAGVGVALHLDDHPRAATGLYIGGGLGVGLGATGLALRW